MLGIVLEQVKKKEPEAYAAWPEAEKVYQAWGSPLNEVVAVQVIESIQVEFRRRGLRYARVLLRCKIELQEGRRVLIQPQPQPQPQEIAAPVVQCIHCGREFRRLRSYEDPRIHSCGELDRIEWGFVKPQKSAPGHSMRAKEA